MALLPALSAIALFLIHQYFLVVRYSQGAPAPRQTNMFCHKLLTNS